MGQLTFNSHIRDLVLEGVITLSDGSQIHVGNGDGNTPIFSYSFDNSLGGDGLNLGSTESGSYSLKIENVNKAYRPAMFDSAEVHMRIGIMVNDVIQKQDFGVWYVESAEVPEQGMTVTLSGNDALATKFETLYAGTNVNKVQLGTLARTVCNIAGIPIETTNFLNTNVQVSAPKDDDVDYTLRDWLSYIAICAGGYVQMTRAGKVLIRSFADGEEYDIDPSLYRELTEDGGSRFEFNAIEAYVKSDDEEYTRFAIDSTIADNPTNTVQIDYFPFVSTAIMNSVVSELSGIEIDPCTMTWGGDPAVVCGDYWNVTNLQGDALKILVTKESFNFDGGLSYTATCNLPSKDPLSSASYSTASSVFDSKGNIRATKIANLDKTVVQATEGYFDKVVTEELVTDTLTAKIIDAVNINSDKISANSIDAKVAAIDFLTSGTISADLITAGTLDANKITVKGTVDAEEVSGTLGTFVKANIGTADIDFAQIKIGNIGTTTTDTLIVRDQSNMDKVYIDRLKVRNAQMVTATVNELVVKASNGQYYRLDVDANGGVTPINVTNDLEDSEISAGVTKDGHGTIIETDLTVTDLATTTFTATSALIHGKLTADLIDAVTLTAKDAFVDSLSAVTLRGKQGTLGVIAGNAEADSATLKKYFSFGDDGFRTRSYVKDDSGVEQESPWSTLTDNTGFHVDNVEKSGHVASFAKDRLTVPSIDVGGVVVMKKSSNGGMKWVVSVREV